MPLRRAGPADESGYVIIRPMQIPDPNPEAKKAILAAQDTSPHRTTAIPAAMTKNAMARASKEFLDFIGISFSSLF